MEIIIAIFSLVICSYAFYLAGKKLPTILNKKSIPFIAVIIIVFITSRIIDYLIIGEGILNKTYLIIKQILVALGQTSPLLAMLFFSVMIFTIFALPANFVVRKFTKNGMLEKYCRNIFVTSVTLVILIQTIKVTVNSIQLSILIAMSVLILTVAFLISNWREYFQDKYALYVCYACNIIGSYLLYWALLGTNVGSNIIGSYATCMSWILFNVFLGVILYILDPPIITFRRTLSYKLLYVWSSLIMMITFITLSLQLTGYINRYELESVRAFNEGSKAIVEIKRQNAFSKRVNGFNFTETKSLLEEGVNEGNIQKIKKAQKALAIFMEDQRAIKKAKIEISTGYKDAYRDAKKITGSILPFFSSDKKIKEEKVKRLKTVPKTTHIYGKGRYVFRLGKGEVTDKIRFHGSCSYFITSETKNGHFKVFYNDGSVYNDKEAKSKSFPIFYIKSISGTQKIVLTVKS